MLQQRLQSLGATADVPEQPVLAMEEEEVEEAGPSSQTSAEHSLQSSEPHRESAHKATQFSLRKPPHRSVGMVLFALQLSVLANTTFI